VELSVAQRAIEASGGSRALLDDAHRIADGAVNTVRDLSHLLHPSLLDDLGLPAAVDWYLKGLAARHGLQVELVQEGMDQRLAPEVESAAFRIVQEALTNVVRHSRASSCYIHLGRTDETFRLLVQDNGVGFDAAGLASSDRRGRGLGLIGIRERASSLGGTARVEAAPGRGTRLIVELPGRVRPAVADVDDAAASETAQLPNLEMIRG
jgi:signal transduction histidine kinase